MGNEVSAKKKDETNVPVAGDGINSINALPTTINNINSLNEEDHPSNNHSSSTSTLNDSAPAAGSTGVSSSSKGIVVVRRRDEVIDRRLPGQDELERIAGIPRFTPILCNSVSTAPSLPWPSHGSIGSPVTTVATSNTILSGASSTQQVYSAGAFTINNSRALHQPRNSISSSKPFRRTAPLSEEGHVDYKGILLLAARYQEHLRQCAEAVTFDQNALCVSMKDVDSQLQLLASTLTERQRKYARLMEQLRKVSEMRRVLSKMRISADNIARAVDEMNSRLPADLQLEPFCFLPNAEDKFQENADMKAHYPITFKCLFSCMAATVAETVTYPLDIVKTRLQLYEGKKRSRGMIGTGASIVRHEGFTMLWKGLSPAVYRHLIYSGIRFSLYEQLREFLLSPDSCGQFPVWKAAACGVISGAVAQFVANPMDLVKVLLQMEGLRQMQQKPARVHNTSHALRVIFNESGVRGLWRGCVPNVQRAALVNMADLATYDSAKRFLRRHSKLEDNYLMHGIAATMSGLVCAIVSTPADCVKTRIMNQTIQSGQVIKYRGSFDCLLQVVRQEGFMALYRGFIPIWTRMAPWSLTFWVSFEQIRRITGAPSF